MMKKRFNKIISILFAGLLLSSVYAGTAFAWSEHAMILNPMFQSMPEVAKAKPVKAETLGSFLVAEGNGLEKILKSDEEWNRKNLKNYRALPDALFFKASADPKEAIKRFCDAVRISDRYYYTLYIRQMPGSPSTGAAIVKGSKLTYLKDLSDIDDRTYLRVLPGKSVSVIDVLGTASDEIDLGIDIGLFEDNETAQGKKLNFGKQPFGNPNLEYSSQAPFHMGFYNEAGIVYALAGFLKETYPEYRIHQFKVLSEYAFKTGHDYWGWRFMGWGIHYLSDISMPYHSVVLPGVSTAKMLWINTIAMTGKDQAKKDAVQLVSNRHGALEKYQKYATRNAYAKKNGGNILIAPVKTALQVPVYNDNIPRENVSKMAAKYAKETDKALVECMPPKYVSDPKVEFNDLPGTDRILDTVMKEKGRQCIDKMDALDEELFKPAVIYSRSYIEAILKRK
jgi:hypothetical protein